jgi:hypothetical protein
MFCADLSGRKRRESQCETPYLGPTTQVEDLSFKVTTSAFMDPYTSVSINHIGTSAVVKS